MLTKAILTGGVLSVLAGSIVYFGTEGADALESDVREDVRLEETELAGGVEDIDVAVDNDMTVDNVEAADPPQGSGDEKPKTKWLDQYLKKTKGEPKPEKKSEIVTETETENVIETVESDENGVEKKVRIKTRMRKGGSDSAKGTYIVTKDKGVETVNIEELDPDGLDLDNLNLDGDIDVDMLKDRLGVDGEKNVEIRVIKKKMDGKPTRFSFDSDESTKIDYEAVLNETKKLMVTDMRNQAVLEIVDYAIDNGDMVEAADLVEELSTPELRDTARARIGTGLARAGKTEAAFAVLEELEIDELSAPIRLEIITALMATKQERKNFVSQ